MWNQAGVENPRVSQAAGGSGVRPHSCCVARGGGAAWLKLFCSNISLLRQRGRFLLACSSTGVPVRRHIARWHPGGGVAHHFAWPTSSIELSSCKTPSPVFNGSLPNQELDQSARFAPQEVEGGASNTVGHDIRACPEFKNIVEMNEGPSGFLRWGRRRGRRERGAGPANALEPHLFRVVFLRRFRQSLSLSQRNCRCGRFLDACGHHRAKCSRVGMLGRRRFADGTSRRNAALTDGVALKEGRSLARSGRSQQQSAVGCAGGGSGRPMVK